MPAEPDPHDLQRFVGAQQPLFDQVRAELAAGAKRSHWMWFVFPQLRALGRSATARYYGIGSRAEALAYWRHPVLGARLKDCVSLLLALPPGSEPERVMGGIDAIKLRSCLTLFDAVAGDEPAFAALLDRWYGGRRDEATLALI